MNNNKTTKLPGWNDFSPGQQKVLKVWIKLHSLIALLSLFTLITKMVNLW